MSNAVVGQVAGSRIFFAVRNISFSNMRIPAGKKFYQPAFNTLLPVRRRFA